MEGKLKILVKALLALILCGCWFSMPYGYYQFVRLSGFIGFAWLAYVEYDAHRFALAVLSGMLAILINPVVKIHFTRELWNEIDLSIAFALGVWIIADLIALTKEKNSFERHN